MIDHLERLILYVVLTIFAIYGLTYLAPKLAQALKPTVIQTRKVTL